MNAEPMIGKEVSHYRVLAEIGKGAMGIVYEAEDTRLGRKVALKFLTEVSGDPHALERFQREARAASALNHPHICTIYDIGEFEGAPFIVMERLEGQPLKTFMGKKPVPIPELLNLALQIASALEATHAKGIVHRDIKPANIFVTSGGSAKMVHFGLAKIVEAGQANLEQTVVGDAEPEPEPPAADDPVTLTGTMVGTIAYMSPEQVLGREVDARTDIFSFGVLLYEMAAGYRPFLGPGSRDLTDEILHATPRAPSRVNAALPAGLERVIERCLEKDPALRYPSGRELLADLNALQQPAEPAAAGAKSRTKRSSRVRRRKVRVDSIAVLPFENRSVQGDTEYLSDGVAESIINSLSRLRRLRVMARSSVSRYKGRGVNPVTAGAELQVQAVLTGYVTQQGDTLAIAAELVDVADGSQLWGKTYNCKRTELLDVLEEAPREICERLNLELTGEEKQHVAKRQTENSQAYELYLKGRYHWNQRTVEGIYIALDYFQQAIEKDPKYALAYTGLSDCYALLCFYDVAAPIAVFPKAKWAAAKAIELDPSLAEAHASAGMLWAIWDFDWAESEKELKRAIELRPGYASAHHWYATCLSALGRTAAAAEEIRCALSLEPLSPGINVDAALVSFRGRRYDEAMLHCREMLQYGPGFGRPVHHLLGRCHIQKQAYGEAIAEFRKALEMSPTSLGDLAYLGLSHGLASQPTEARGILAQLAELRERQYVSLFYSALVHLGLGETDSVFDCLRKACDDRYPQVAYLRTDPVFDPLRSDSRFVDLLQRIGMDESIQP